MSHDENKGVPAGRGLALLLLPALVFPLGYVVTAEFFSAYALEYLLLTAVSMVACAFLLPVLRRPFIEELPVVLLLVVFLVAYYFKFYLMVLRPDLVYLLPLRMDRNFIFDATMIRVYATTTWAFVAFCFSSMMFCVLSGPYSHRQHQLQPTIFAMHLSFALALILIVVSSLLVVRFNIVMGLPGQALPFRLGGLIVYLRTITIPVLLVLITWGGFQLRHKWWPLIGGVTMMVYGVSDMLLRTTKGKLFFLLMAMSFLWLLQGNRVRVMHVVRALIAAPFMIVAFQLIGDARFVRHNYTGSMLEAVTTAAAMQLESISVLGFFSTISAAIERVLMRLSGSDLLVALVAYNAEQIEWRIWEVLLRPRGFAGYLTVDIFGAPAELIHVFGLAPSLVGFFYIIGGNALVLLGISVFTITILWLWRKLVLSNLGSKVVSQVFLLMFVLNVAIDGVLDRAIMHQLPVYIFSLVLCECLWWVGRTRIRIRGFAVTGQRGGGTP
jgi:hypothetical protein